MKVDLYTNVGVYGRALDTLAHILNRGAEHAAATGVAEAEMLDWRLAPDMFNLRQQAQVVINFSRQWLARAAGTTPAADIPEGLDLAGLQAAIQSAKADVLAFKAEQFEGRDGITHTQSLGAFEPTLPMGQWIVGFATPNVYFHLSMAYAICRHKGAKLGKPDFFAGGL